MGRVTKSMDDDQTVFEVTITKEGKHRDFTIASDGSILEKEVFLDEVPQKVKNTILQTAAGATVDDITQTTDDGQTNYDVEIIKGENTRDFTLGADGQLLSQEMLLAETPVAAQKTIREKTQGASKVEIYRTDRIYYGSRIDWELRAVSGIMKQKPITCSSSVHEPL